MLAYALLLQYIETQASLLLHDYTMFVIAATKKSFKTDIITSYIDGKFIEKPKHPDHQK